MKIKPLITISWILIASSTEKMAAEASPDIIENQRYDVVVAGGTPGGLATAIRASREGLSVLVVNHTKHLGGMLTNGLGVLDTEYYRARSPIYDEMCARLVSHYGNKTFSRDTYKRSDVGERLYYEPHVIENILNEMVAAEEISVLLNHYPAGIIKTGTTIEAVRFQKMEEGSSVLVGGRYFVDAMYEADLAALAGVPYRVGRESRAEYGEPHAGVSFTYLVDTRERSDRIKDLRIHKFRLSSREIPHPRNGEGDHAIQAYNFRMALSRDPVNRYLPPRPDNYDPEAYQIIKERLSPLPNSEGRFGWKVTGWNTPILPGGNHDYPNASWPARREIAQKHLDWAIGILHYLQRDLPEPVWGLAKDEFVDNGYVPWEMYVREARRIQGLKTFTEHDGLLFKDFGRAPIHSGSIAITEWALDSHACTTDRYQNSRPEGKVLLAEDTVPGQVDFRCLISEEASNLIVPVCLSSTHIGWGTIRLEPTWMHIGESVGLALKQAKQARNNLLEIDIDRLQKTLAENRILLTYFDDVEILQSDSFVPALQYLGAKGFFPSYQAKPDEGLDSATARHWITAVSSATQGHWTDPNQIAAALARTESTHDGSVLSWSGFIRLTEEIDSEMGKAMRLRVEPASIKESLSRGEACEILYTILFAN